MKKFHSKNLVRPTLWQSVRCMWEQLKIALMLKSILFSKLIFKFCYSICSSNTLIWMSKHKTLKHDEDKTLFVCFSIFTLPHISHFIGITKTNGSAVTKQGRDSKAVSKNTTNNNNSNNTTTTTTSNNNNKSTVRKVSGEVKQTKKQTTVVSKRPEEKITNSTNSNKNKKVRKSSKGKKTCQQVFI